MTMSGRQGKADLNNVSIEVRKCEGFRMTADRDDAACTGAVVRKPPMKERARGWVRRLPRAMEI